MVLPLWKRDFSLASLLGDASPAKCYSRSNSGYLAEKGRKIMAGKVKVEVLQNKMWKVWHKTKRRALCWPDH